MIAIEIGQYTSIQVNRSLDQLSSVGEPSPEALVDETGREQGIRTQPCGDVDLFMLRDGVERSTRLEPGRIARTMAGD
jgi:hypothetical protein